MVHEIGAGNSIFNQFIREIRDEVIQKDRLRFRRNLERIGEVMAYEVSKQMEYEEVEVTTPLGVASTRLPKQQPVLCAIMRAAIPMHQGFLNFFDAADNAFVAAYRRHHKGGEFEIEIDYTSSPSIQDREVIIIDPMIATGSSIELVYKALLQKGNPSRIHVVGALATSTGINKLRSKLPENTLYWLGAIDTELTAQAYIVPGLGDAGDLAYGRKD